MRRREHVPEVDGQLPAELVDRHHPTWSSDAATNAWCRTHHLVLIRPVAEDQHTAIGTPAWLARRRRSRALWAWAAVNGVTNPAFPEFPDWHRLRALGARS